MKRIDVASIKSALGEFAPVDRRKMTGGLTSWLVGDANSQGARVIVTCTADASVPEALFARGMRELRRGIAMFSRGGTWPGVWSPERCEWVPGNANFNADWLRGNT